MTNTRQAALPIGAPSDPTTPPDKVELPKDRLLTFADDCEQRGEKWKASAIRSGCLGFRDMVPVSRGLAERWGLIE